MEDKRKRTLNFTSDEKSLLTELVSKYKAVVENKKSDATTNADKARGWKHISQEFNALSTYCSRPPESLKTCWENIKRQTKKLSANRKREVFKTGGGRPPPPSPGTGAGRIVEEILGPALEGIENQYDSDALLYDDCNKDTAKMCSDAEEIGTDEVINAVVETEDEPSCSLTFPIAEVNSDNKDNNPKWEGWTPNSLKRPISDVLKSSKDSKVNNSWLKRRRPNQQNLGDQLVQEKIDLVKTLKENAGEESRRRILILDEQLKQEKIKTQNILQTNV